MAQVVKLCKRELLDIYQQALDAVKPDKLIRQSVALSDSNIIVSSALNAELKPISCDISGSRLHVIGGGKCVLGMARGLAQLARDTSKAHLFSHGSLSLPVSQESDLDAPTRELLDSLQITCRFGAKNNLPDKESEAATQAILDCIEEAVKHDTAHGLKPLFIVLLSGGGSACLTKPGPVVELADKLGIIQNLVQMGANIEELNLIRQQLSDVKGGRLAKHILKSCTESQILTLIISDVPGDPIESIASGPTRTTRLSRAERDLLDQIERKYNCTVYDLQLGLYVGGEFDMSNVSNVILGNNTLAIRAATSRAEELGYSVVPLIMKKDSTTGEIVDSLDTHVSARKQRSRKCLGISGGEAKIVKGDEGDWGVGGRAQETAMRYISKFHDFYTDGYEYADENVPGDFIDVFFAGTTDGQDGPTNVSGCFASVAEFIENKPFDLNAMHKACWNHDSNTFWSAHKPDWLVRSGPTGTNVMDLYMLAKIYSH